MEGDVLIGKHDEREYAPLLTMLLISFPMAVALAQRPLLVGFVVATFLCLAWKTHCIKPFTITLGVALVLSMLVFTGAVIHFDIDNYLAPQIRQMLLPDALPQNDGWYSPLHCRLPSGLSTYGAALYRIFGSVDLGDSAFILFAVAAWHTLRASLTRLQTLLLLCAPVALPGLLCLMPDGCVYLLLLIALFELRKQTFWLPLLAISIACTYKTSAWLPAILIAGALLYMHPRRWWQIALMGLATLALCLPTLSLILSGELTQISSDFHATANADARSMGHFARLAYVHLGHWTTSLTPLFGAHTAGVDGISSDALGPILRLCTWASLLLMPLYRHRLKGWWLILAISWGSLLCIPTLYIGYARYVPLLFIATFLPLVLLFPRISILPLALLLIIPLGMLGWRFALSTEALFVANTATAVHSEYYNIRSTFRPLLVDTPQPHHSGSLLYTYALPEGNSFPPIPRKHYPGIETTPTLNKISEVKTYMLHQWLPWIMTHPHTYIAEIVRYRWRAFCTFPRGIHDGPQTP